MKQLMFKLEELRLKELFKDFVSIDELRGMMNPAPARSTIVNAILRQRLDAKQLSENERGTYIIYLPSAKKLWPERFDNSDV